MSSLINPKCGVPTFVQTDKKLVGECGSYTGYIIAGLITLVLLFILHKIMSEKFSDKLSEEEIETLNKSRNTKIIIIIISIILIFIFVPKISSFLSKNSWESYQSQISQYMAQGLSRQDAINKIQSLYQTEYQAAAILGAGATMAGFR
jgi:hypothetical protein